MSGKRNKKEIKKQTKQRSQWYFLGGLLAFTFIIYSQNFKHEVLWGWDDGEYIENEAVQQFDIAEIFSSYQLGMYQPLSVLTLSMNYKMSGLKPGSYYFTNLLLHLINILLVFSLIKRLSGNEYIAGITALIFVIHPMNVEAVSWISARSTMLFTFFFLLSVSKWIKFRESGNRYTDYLASMLFFLLALFSKSMSMSLPLVLIAMDILIFKKDIMSSLLNKIPFLVFSVIFGMITIDASQSFGHLSILGQDYSILNRIFILLNTIAFYILKGIFPVKLSAIYAYPEIINGSLPVWYYLSGLLLVAILVLLIYFRKDRNKLLFGLAFFLLTIVVVLPLFWSRIFIAADRYAYLSFIGIYFCIAILGNNLYYYLAYKKNHRNLLIGIAALYILFLGISTFNRIKKFKNTKELLTDVITNSSNLNARAQAYFYRANVYDKLQDVQNALKDYSSSINLDRTNRLAYNNRGIILGSMGELQKAYEDFNNAIKLDNEYADAYYNRGIIFFQAGEQSKACLDWKTAQEYGSPLAKEALKRYCEE